MPTNFHMGSITCFCAGRNVDLFNQAIVQDGVVYMIEHPMNAAFQYIIYKNAKIKPLDNRTVFTLILEPN